MSDLALPPLSTMDPERRTWLIATTASERAQAAGAAVAVDLADIPPGGLKTVEWRGKPVWIMRRTPEMIAALSGQDDKLADPNSSKDALPEALRNPGRSERQDLFVAIGICTHLG